MDNGFWKVDAYIARSGCQLYHTEDGKPFIEYRPPEEVFSPEALASFQNVPLTLDHPAEALVDSANVRKHIRGVVAQDVRRDGNRVRASLIVMDEELLDEMVSGRRRQLSCGYTVELDMTPGSNGSEKWDAVQRRPRGNHVAAVVAGRAGPEVAAKMDSAIRCDAMPVPVVDAGTPLPAIANPERAQDAAENGSQRNADATSDPSRQGPVPSSTSQGDATAIATPPKELPRMAKTKINDADVELEANTASLLDAERNRKDAEHKSKLDALTSERDNALKAKTDAEALAKSKADEAAKFSGELEIAKTKLDTATAQVAELSAKIESFAKADLASKVSPVLGDSFKADGKSVREIKCAVIEKVTGKQVSADKADAFVDVVFDGAMEIFESKNPALAAARAATVATDSERADTQAPDPDKKRAEVAAKAQAAWKTPKGGK